MNNNHNKVMSFDRLNIFIFILAIFILVIFHVSAWALEEMPVELPKTEGSKNFDFEIGHINSQGIKLFINKSYSQAIDKFNKAINLANQLRSPGKGILYYNHALSAHEFGEHEKAIKSFLSSRRFARGNEIILNSKLLKLYECGLNPSVTCEEKIPLSLNIEGSH